MKPSLIVIPGFQKCGTSTLARVLCEHEEISKPRIVEPCFFLKTQTKIRENEEDYKDQLNIDEGVGLDASTLYVNFDSVAKKIKHFEENIKVVIMIRDPAKRCYSSYLEASGIIPSIEKRDYEAIVDKMIRMEDLEHVGVEHAEEYILGKAESDDKIDNSHLRKWLKTVYRKYTDAGGVDPRQTDTKWQYRYFSRSLYTEQIEAWKKIIGKESVYVCAIEDLTKNTSREIDRICNFLGLKKNIADSLPQENKTRLANNRLRKGLRIIAKRTNLSNPIGSLFGQKAINKAKDLLFEKKRFRDDLYWKTKYVLKEEYERWSREAWTV